MFDCDVIISCNMSKCSGKGGGHPGCSVTGMSLSWSNQKITWLAIKMKDTFTAAYPHVNEEPQNWAAQFLACFNGHDC